MVSVRSERSTTIYMRDASIIGGRSFLLKLTERHRGSFSSLVARLLSVFRVESSLFRLRDTYGDEAVYAHTAWLMPYQISCHVSTL